MSAYRLSHQYSTGGSDASCSSIQPGKGGPDAVLLTLGVVGHGIQKSETFVHSRTETFVHSRTEVSKTHLDRTSLRAITIKSEPWKENLKLRQKRPRHTTGIAIWYCSNDQSII
jgi:hypothetical protein